MSNKQISKDNRDYWSNKLSRKFRDKKSTIESLHQAEINETTQKNFPTFVKRLGVEKDIEKYLKVEKEFNDYSKNYAKRLEEKREQVKKFFQVLSIKLNNWAETRQWDTYDMPKYDYDNKLYDLKDKLDDYLRSQCKLETKNAFYKSKKGLELQKLDELEEKATDLLHSDMIGSEVLKQISLIAKQTQINMTIPTDTIKSLPNG
jgi:Asp-tRNA(Asn)/Glu-tRNA(Gln) amidotransferase A subunit family amidase